MEVTPKLALEIYTIVVFHLIAILCLFGYSAYVYLKSKKTPLLYSYLSVNAMLFLWMFAKIGKTISPTASIRWFFIVSQYFGVEYLSYCLLLFSLLYSRDARPKKKVLAALLVLPSLGFLAVITNPLHMKFYSYYDFYKDRFGPLFFPILVIQYTYLFISIILLAKNFTTQPGFQDRKKVSWLLLVSIVISLLGNGYYIAFKLTPLPWIFPFPVFDFTPITSSFALILFTIPAFHYRFLDILPVSYQTIYDALPHGYAYQYPNGTFCHYNLAFQTMVLEDAVTLQALEALCKEQTQGSYLLPLQDEAYYQCLLYDLGLDKRFLAIHDLRMLYNLKHQLQQKNEALLFSNQKLALVIAQIKELSLLRTHTKIAQLMHDSMGHSFFVALGNCALIQSSESKEEALLLLRQTKELLKSSLYDLSHSCDSDSFVPIQTSLIKAISSLKNPHILVDVTTQGQVYELNTKQTEAIFRLCQEATTNSIRHGKASCLHLILRYLEETIELYAIDDGIGCKNIQKGYGLYGMEARIAALEGSVRVGSDGERGFHIHVTLPRWRD